MHPYQRVVADVRRRIEAGELRPGDRVPSARQITQQWGVAVATATKAHAAMREEGLTISRPGVGTVVAGPAPRRDHELSLERIVAAAIAIADEEGMAELSMRRLAGSLGVSTMALYRHVPGKTELTDAMLDAALGEVRLPRHPPHWRPALEVASRLEWRVFQRHPWLATTMSLTRPQLTPNGLRLSEWVMAAFNGTRLTLSERMYIQIVLFTYTRGVASALEPEAEAIRDTGLTNDQWMESQAAAAATVMADEGLPLFRELTSQEFDFDLNRVFEFGLSRLLDGLASFVASRG